MRLVLVAFAVAIGLGYLLGGRLSWLSGIKVRWFPLALVGLCMQMAPVPGNRWPVYLLYASFVLLLVFASANLKVTGFAIIAVGILYNFTVIAANGGMPVSKQSLIDSGQASTLSALVHSGGAKHHLVGPDDRLTYLADVIAIPAPVSQSVSLGDIFTYGGVCVLIVSAMRRKPTDLMAAPGRSGLAVEEGG
ncbi:MAG: hypothetical protein QOI81_1029 [Actinomycetota bacterium]|jgi:hypothetical protein|nr:hypothetical protein [Actinomycetota bacterium]